MQLRFRHLIGEFAADESGATAIEYSIIAAGIAAAIVTAVTVTGTTVKTELYDKILTAMSLT